MMKFLFAIALFCIPFFAVSQDKDTTLVVKDSLGTIVPKKPVPADTAIAKKDSVAKKKFSPRQAAIRSAIFPGLGQVYNKKYWKVPIVWGAVGVPVYLFFDNKAWYDRTRYALAVVASNTTNQDSLNRVHPQLSTLVANKATNSLLRYRNEFRKNMDYSVLFTLLLWGLNIVDATVDAHLKGFNVSDDLTMRIKPTMLPGNTAGLSLVFAFR